MFSGDRLFIRIPYHILVERLKIVLEHRFNVEVYFDAATLDTIPLFRLRQLKETMDLAGLRLILHGPYLDLNPGSLDSRLQEIVKRRYLQTIRLCSFLGANQIVFHHGYNPIYHGFIYKEWLEESVRFWMEIAVEAEGEGVVIGLENAFEGGPFLLKDVLSSVNSLHLGCCLDVGHMNVGSKLGLEAWMRELKRYIIEIHLHDNNGTYDAHLALGEGVIDFKLLFKLLDESGVKPTLTLENNSEEDFLKSIAWLKENLILIS